jgi:hypothetical protein
MFVVLSIPRQFKYLKNAINMDLLKKYLTSESYRLISSALPFGIMCQFTNLRVEFFATTAKVHWCVAQ